MCDCDCDGFTKNQLTFMEESIVRVKYRDRQVGLQTVRRQEVICERNCSDILFCCCEAHFQGKKRNTEEDNLSLKSL